MRLGECSEGGTDSSQDKTPPHQIFGDLVRGRNEKICENSRRIAGIKVIVQPVVVPVPLTIVPVEVQDITVAVRVPQKCIEYRQFHHLLNALKVVSYL